MALHNGIDTEAYVCGGWYTSTYITVTGGGNIASLLVSYGLLEEATGPAPVVVGDFSWFRRGWFSRLRKGLFRG